MKRDPSERDSASRASWLCGLLFLAAAPSGVLAAADLPVNLVQASVDIPEARLLDVGIEVFDPGLPELDEDSLEEKGVFADVRKSEARYFAFHLKSTLQSTGFWGAVRVVPQGTQALDLRISGTIVESTGRKLVLEIAAYDATGRKWLEERYKRVANERIYNSDDVSVDPYQDLYNEVSNDLHKRWSKLDAEDVGRIRDVALLQFASNLAPQTFAGYLTEARKGRVEIARLPSSEDPMMQRVNRIRERDYMFVDTLNEYYSNFYQSMDAPYDEWRSFSYEEQMALRAVKRQARIRTLIGALAIIGGAAAGGGAGDVAVIGGAYAIESGLSIGRESRIHREALRELAASFDAEIAPVLINVEGETIRLSGAAETQFQEWRELLKKMFADETGFPLDANDSPSQKTSQP